MIKEEYFDSLIFDMGNCKRCIELKNRNGIREQIRRKVPNR